MRFSKKTFYLYLLAILMAYCVIVLGAYTRLSDAGLGCPDWPGCYGKIFVPEKILQVEQANQAFPERPLEKGKAWKEMIHRYAAAILGLIILLLTVSSWSAWAKDKHTPVVAPTALLLLVIFQAALGMWTVTLLLKPVIVTAHLMGGMAIIALLHWQMLAVRRPSAANKPGAITPWAMLGLAVLSCQIVLGGWTSANYAALICTDFPTCQGQWWPPMEFKEGFILWRGLGVDYEFGVLDAPARTAVHVSHRIGALLTFVVLGSLAIKAFVSNKRSLMIIGASLMLILIAQVSLGIANVLLALPLSVAVAHNAVAALLLLCLVTLLYYSLSTETQAEQ